MADTSFFNLTAPALMAHPHLIKAQAFTDSKTGKAKGDPKFGAAFVLDPTHPDLDPFKKHCFRIFTAAYPSVDLKEVNAWPFKSGTKLADKRKAKCEEKGKKADGEWQRGKAVIEARSEYRPRLAILEPGRGILDLNDEDAIKAHSGKFYFGTMALAAFNVVANKIDAGERTNYYVSAYVQMVLTLNKGERIGGARPAGEVFRGYVGQMSNEDPTAGSDIGDASW